MKVQISDLLNDRTFDASKNALKRFWHEHARFSFVVATDDDFEEMVAAMVGGIAAVLSDNGPDEATGDASSARDVTHD